MHDINDVSAAEDALMSPVEACPHFEAKEFSDMVDTVIADYAKATLLVRLPGAIPIPAFSNIPSITYAEFVQSGQNAAEARTAVNVSLVARSSKKPRDQVLRSIGVSESDLHKKVLLISFGGQNIQKKQWRTALPDGWIGVTCGGGGVNGVAKGLSALADGFYVTDKDAFIPDITNACDVVLGKLGYG